MAAAKGGPDALLWAAGIAITGVILLAVVDVVAHGSIEPAILALVASTVAPLVPALLIRYSVSSKSSNGKGHEP